MKTIVWVDLTDIVSWSGSLTGIQRVAYSIAKEYAENDARVKFFIFNDLKQEFNEHDLASVDFSRQQTDTYISSGLKQKLKKFEKIVPPVVWSRSLRLVKKVRQNNTVNPKVFTKKAFVSRAVKHPFNKNDIVLVCGLNIASIYYLQSIHAAKQKTGFKFAHFIQDTIPFHREYCIEGMYEYYYPYFKQVLQYSDLIFAISKNTKKDIEHFAKREFNIEPPVIKVVRLGEDISKKSKKPSKKIDKKFIISVGSIEIRKNHQALYYAYKLAAEKNMEMPTLYIIGRKGWLSEMTVHQIKNDEEVNKKIHFLSDLSDQELSWMYEHALFTVFPAFYEGWGLPVAESLHRGKLCIASNTSSIPEIGGKLTPYINPYDPADIAQKVHYYFENNNMREVETRALVKEYKLTTWNDTYRQVDSFLKRI